MKIVTTTDELLEMRNDAGVIDHDGDLRIECDVLYAVGRQIAGIVITGDAVFRGDAVFVGSADFRGNADFESYADFRGNAVFGGNAAFWGNAAFGGDAAFWGDYLAIFGDMIWGQCHKPALPEETYIKRILPPSHQREHWQERLGVDLGEGCYDAICPRVLVHIDRLLSETKWSSTERWMLETLRDSKKPVPEWVAVIRDAELGSEA